MSTPAVIAVSLAVVVGALALATRRKPVDPLARALRPVRPRAPGTTRSPEQGAFALRTAWKLLHGGSDAIHAVARELRAGCKNEAVARLRDALGLDLADATRLVDEIEAQLASGGPLVKLLGDANGPAGPGGSS